MKQDKDITKVIFRKWDNGDIIALFPELPGDRDLYTCLSYEHIGQHGAADIDGVIDETFSATLQEYTPLLQELESIGYNLKVCKRYTIAMLKNRTEAYLIPYNTLPE